jgi:hypothetical protein
MGKVHFRGSCSVRSLFVPSLLIVRQFSIFNGNRFLYRIHAFCTVFVKLFLFYSSLDLLCILVFVYSNSMLLTSILVNELK